MDRLSAAHPTLPLPVYVQVTNLANNRSIVVRVTTGGRSPMTGSSICRGARRMRSASVATARPMFGSSICAARR
ncbi:septal ring lytic transglycosylase RlpA family protein [Methyloceanibacter superfactus]|uniref:septal ring lytic transglycosylase RlpA family protein n=1 Tax=Methyloceanibacter superfactus TaxID=1774969 RepID=UPI001FCCE33A|nr:septal ring lytic transglycosylase RlpA family protein [Methyloceanibacter superfactus]